MKEKMNKTFGELETGDKIYYMREEDLEIKEMTVTNVQILTIVEDRVILTLDSMVEGRNWISEFTFCTNSGFGTIFTTREEALGRLKLRTQKKYLKLTEEIDKLVAEFEKLEKFLKDVDKKEIL